MGPGTVFQGRSTDEGGQFIEENLHSGVELFGVKGIEAEMELLSLLIAAVKTLDLTDVQRPQLFGHTALMDQDEALRGDKREAIRSAPGALRPTRD